MHNKGDRKTIIGNVDADTLAYTAGDDVAMDLCIVKADCIGSAAHVTMLSDMPDRLFSVSQKDRIISELVQIMRDADGGSFKILLEDQDVHLAIERILTERLGDMARAIHTARSRNDQIAVDLRLYGKEQLLSLMGDAYELCSTLKKMAEKHRSVPMVGRTHMRPAMPSSVGLWAYSYAESLLEDMTFLKSAYDINNQCPLGSAAGYGVPLPIDRQQLSDLLGFRRPVHSVLHASNARGKTESMILSALSQVMITISRMSQDLIMFSMPEFNFFILPARMGTGSSIMPQKNNPDILELVRARTCRVTANAHLVMDIVKGLPGGYNRDLQETKGPFFEGLKLTRASIKILTPFMEKTRPNRKALSDGFTPEVFATDYALELVARGTPFRSAYSSVKEQIADLKTINPAKALARRKHLGAPAGLDFELLSSQIASGKKALDKETKHYHRAVSKLLKTDYPFKQGHYVPA